MICTLYIQFLIERLISPTGLRIRIVNCVCDFLGFWSGFAIGNQASGFVFFFFFLKGRTGYPAFYIRYPAGYKIQYPVYRLSVYSRYQSRYPGSRSVINPVFGFSGYPVDRIPVIWYCTKRILLYEIFKLTKGNRCNQKLLWTLNIDSKQGQSVRYRPSKFAVTSNKVCSSIV